MKIDDRNSMRASLLHPTIYCVVLAWPFTKEALLAFRGVPGVTSESLLVIGLT